MKSVRLRLGCFSAILFFLLSGCSDPERDYGKVQQTLNASAASYREQDDSAVKIQACNAAIGALRTFLDKHSDGEWAQQAHSELAAWELKKSILEHQPASPFEELSVELRHQAIQQASKKHPTAELSEVRCSGRTSSKIADTVRVTEEYTVTMRGEAGHRSILTVRIRTSGRIALASKRVFVDGEEPSRQ